MADLAAALGMPASTLSCYVTGRTRNARRQMAIWMAFCDITGSRVTLEQFWGDLLSERIRAA